MSKKVKRLLSSFMPQHYSISLEISEDKESFVGNVVIVGRKQGRPSKRITLHQNNLCIHSVKVKFTGKKGESSDIPIHRTVTQKSYDELRIHASDTLYPGNYKIEIEFSGKITANMDGVYPCIFEEDGTQKKLIATQFESHHAREAFPCIDEPEAKATFELSLTTDKIDTVISNTPIVKETVAKNRKTTRFEITPIMSTYLLAFVTGELSYLEKKSSRGVTLRTYATKNQVEHTQFALDVAAKCLDFYEEYYDIPYPLEKCDFIALPDFASGAMENWGCITFREQALLCDEHTSLPTKQYVAIVVAHELTHQWFGNLVTMSWWTDLWLNEGFASWMEYLALDSLFPEWELWTQFMVDSHETALRLDALEHTHPVEVAVKHPDEIRTIFDGISYEKGAAVIHMLFSYLGAENFKEGIRHYLKTHSYKNTTTVDLWQAFEEVTKKPVTEFMSAWTKQSGFPLIHVNQKDDHLVIKQERFVINPASMARKDTTLWPVPLLSHGIEQPTVTKKLSNVPLANRGPLPKLNNEQTGFYRVVYSDQINSQLRKRIHSGEFGPIDRMGLLADALEGTKAGYESVDSFLNLLEGYNKETHSVVWDIIASALGSIKHTLSTNDDLRESMKPFIKKMSDTQMLRLGWEEQKNEAHLDTLLRPLIIGLKASADDETVVKKLQKLFSSVTTEENNVHPDIRGVVYSTVARLGGEAEFVKLLSLYNATSSSDEKLSITAGITNFEQPEQYNKIFELLVDGKTVRNQDVMYWIAYSLGNRHARQATWEWIKENWEWLKKNMGTDLSFYRMPLYVARNFTNEEQYQDYRQFFEEHMEPVLDRSYKQGLETIEWQKAWHERDAKTALEWFKSRG